MPHHFFNRQSAIGNENLVFGCGYAVLCGLSHPFLQYRPFRLSTLDCPKRAKDFKSTWLAFLDHDLDSAIFLSALGVVTTVGESIGRHRLCRSPPPDRHGAGNAVREHPILHRIGSALGELLVIFSQPFIVRVALKSISFLHGSKLDVIQPNLPRNEIVEFLAWQADKPNNDQCGLWPGGEIQKQRRPSVASAGQVVS